MGETVLSFRKAQEYELQRWKPFREALMNENEKQAFDAIMDMSPVHCIE